MRPVRTARSNFVWQGPTPDIGDLHAHMDRSGDVPVTTTVWEPSPEERTAIADGANIGLEVIGRHPPVRVLVSFEQGIGEDAPKLADRLREWRARQ